MIRIPMVVALVLLFATPLLVQAQGEKEVLAVLEKLRGSRLLDGSHVGEDKHQGTFWLATRTLYGRGDQALFRKLLTDPHPLVRAAGLVCLAEAGAKGTEKILRARIGDYALLDYQPAGVPVTAASVGLLARELLADRNRISSAKESVPVLDEKQLLALDIEILARDDTPAIHKGAAARIERSARAGKLTLVAEGLRTASPGLPLWRAMKVLGRLRRTKSRNTLLKQAYNDPDQPLKARLAAGSAAFTHGLQGMPGGLVGMPDGISDADGDRMVAVYMGLNGVYLFRKGARSPRDYVDESRDLDPLRGYPSAMPTIAAILREVDILYQQEDDWRGLACDHAVDCIVEVATMLTENPIKDWDHSAQAPAILCATFDRYRYLFRRVLSEKKVAVIAKQVEALR